jgi:hypothetical protein
LTGPASVHQSVRLAAISAATQAQARAWPAADSSNRQQAI